MQMFGIINESTEASGSGNVGASNNRMILGYAWTLGRKHTCTYFIWGGAVLRSIAHRRWRVGSSPPVWASHLQIYSPHHHSLWISIILVFSPFIQGLMFVLRGSALLLVLCEESEDNSRRLINSEWIRFYQTIDLVVCWYATRNLRITIWILN